MKYRRTDPTRRRFAMYLVNRPRPPARAGHTQTSAAEPYVPDGWIHPRRSDSLFDVSIRVPNLAAAATTTQRVFTDLSLAQGGIIRALGYAFSQPHGFLQVRTTILVNGAPPREYLFRTVDASAPATFQGSLPPFQIGSPADPTSVFIVIPSNSVIEARFVNASQTESFTCTLRLTGWLYGD